MNVLVIFPTFSNLSVNFAIRSSWYEPQSAPSLFCWLYRASPSLAAKNIISLILVFTIWWCACVGEGSGTPSSTLAWKIPWMEEPGRLQSMGSRRVGHDWATSLSLFTFRYWRRKWQPTPVFLPGESQGWRRLVGCHLWGHTQSDTTEAT